MPRAWYFLINSEANSDDPLNPYPGYTFDPGVTATPLDPDPNTEPILPAGNDIKTVLYNGEKNDNKTNKTN